MDFVTYTPQTTMRTTSLAAALILTAGALASACSVSSHVLVGQSRPPISPDQVQIYSDSPSANFEHIATLKANSRSVFRPGGPEADDKVIERMKIEAAKLGANGIILTGFSDSQSASIGSGVGSESYGRRSAVGVGAGVGGSVGIYKKTGRGEAIYLPPASSPATQ